MAREIVLCRLFFSIFSYLTRSDWSALFFFLGRNIDSITLYGRNLGSTGALDRHVGPPLLISMNDVMINKNIFWYFGCAPWTRAFWSVGNRWVISYEVVTMSFPLASLIYKVRSNRNSGIFLDLAFSSVFGRTSIITGTLFHVFSCKYDVDQRV